MNEKLLKYITKRPELRPTEAEIIEEAGDTIARLILLMVSMEIAKEVEERTESKLAYIYEMMAKGVYGTHLTMERNDPTEGGM